jgi:hypothetical protein
MWRKQLSGIEDTPIPCVVSASPKVPVWSLSESVAFRYCSGIASIRHHPQYMCGVDISWETKVP